MDFGIGKGLFCGRDELVGAGLNFIGDDGGGRGEGNISGAEGTDGARGAGSKGAGTGAGFTFEDTRGRFRCRFIRSARVR